MQTTTPVAINSPYQKIAASPTYQDSNSFAMIMGKANAMAKIGKGLGGALGGVLDGGTVTDEGQTANGVNASGGQAYNSSKSTGHVSPASAWGK